MYGTIRRCLCLVTSEPMFSRVLPEYKSYSTRMDVLFSPQEIQFCCHCSSGYGAAHTLRKAKMEDGLGRHLHECSLAR